MRIVTRGDMDGLTGSVIVSLNETVDDIELIHPQDITDGRADIREGTSRMVVWTSVGTTS